VVIPLLLIFCLSSALIVWYIYTAIPEDIVQNAVYPVLPRIIAVFVIALALFAVLLFYLARNLLKPIHDLTLAGEALSRGDFNGEIASSRAHDEIGVMSRALRRIAEQFRITSAMRVRSGELLEIYTRLYQALYKNDRVEDVFDELLPLICAYFKVSKASLVLVTGVTVRLTMTYERNRGLS
jgi:HAMP domain-containing protein